MEARSVASRGLHRIARRLDPAPPSPAPRAAKKRRQRPRATSAPGSRVVTEGFFDQYPRFYETSETFASPSRLKLRHEAIIGENRDVFEGRRVLDIASHDGRWSFAALQAGAASVVGIEGRPELVDAANATFAHYGVSPERHRFVAGDVFDVLAREPWEFDVVLCLGFLYHTLRYNELMASIRRCGPAYLIVDTEVADGTPPRVDIRVEDVGPQRNAVADDYAHAGRVLSGRPTLAGLETIVGAYGFEVERLSDWAGLVRDNPEDAPKVKNYRRGRRVTMRCATRD